MPGAATAGGEAEAAPGQIGAEDVYRMRGSHRISMIEN